MALTTLLPVAGRTVYLPNTYPLQVMPATGVTVDLSTSTYWQRRVRDGDVTIASTTDTGTGTGGSTGGTGGGSTTTVSGSLSNVPSTGATGGTLTGASYSITGATSGYAVIVAGDSEVGGRVALSAASGGVPAMALPTTAGTYKLRLLGPTGTKLTDSGSIAVAAPTSTGGGTTAPASTIAVNTPANQTAGNAFTAAGSYTGTAPTALDVSTDGGGTWTAVVATIGGGVFSFSMSIAAAGTYAIRVRDRGNTAVSGTSGAFTVSAATGGGGTTTPAPSAAVSGPSAAAVAGQSATFFVDLTGTTSAYLGLETTAGVASGSRVAVSGDSFVSITPAAAGAFVPVVYAAATGTTKLGQGASFTVSAAGGGGSTTPSATITGPSAAAVAGQSATFLVDLTNLTTAYVGLLSGGAATGSRTAVSADGFVTLTMPAATGSYNAAVFSAATGGTEYARTPAFTVSAAGSNTGNTTTPAGKYVTGFAASTDGSGKMLAGWSDGTTTDLSALVQGAVVAGGVSLDAVDAVAVDFPAAVTAVVAPPLSCTGSVNFRTADHHGKTLVFGNGGTLALAAPADAVPGSWCRVLNTAATAQVALGAGVVSAGGNTVAAGQSVTVVAAAGPDGVVRLYAATSLSNQAAAQTLSFSEAIGNQTGGTAFTVRLSYTNGTPTGLEWATSATGPWTVATGAAIADAGSGGGTGSASFLHPGLATATSAYTLRVRDRGNPAVFAVSNAFAVTAPASTGTGTGGTTTPAAALSVTTPAAQTAGTAFTVSGTYANGTPAALDVSTNGGSTWTNVTAAIGGGTFSFSLTIATAGTYAVRVRDRNNTGVVGASGTFTVAAASTGTGTGGTTTPAFVGPLDAYTSTWTGLFSASRRLRAAYTGPAIRVRRVSDGVEQDIAFTSAGALDTATLSAFVGSGNGAVVRWYDQGGAGRNAIPKAGVASPVIVSNGVVQTMAGKPAIRFLGASGDTALVIEGLPAMTGASLFVMAAFQAASLGDYGRLCSFYKDDPSAGGLFMFEGAELQTRRWFGDGSGEATAKAYFIAAGADYVADAEYTGAEARVHVSPAANLNFETAAFTEGFGAGSGGAGIGSALTDNPDEAFDGLIGEFAMSHIPGANERANLAAAMRSHFGVAA